MSAFWVNCKFKWNSTHPLIIPLSSDSSIIELANFPNFGWLEFAWQAKKYSLDVL